MLGLGLDIDHWMSRCNMKKLLFTVYEVLSERFLCRYGDLNRKHPKTVSRMI